jgi:glycine reductase
MGGEDKAGVPLGFYEGARGPGRRLQALLGDKAAIVLTVYCGDNYFNDNRDEVIQEILTIAQTHDVDMVVAGPAFSSGRYGVACVEVCHSISTSLNLDCVTGISIDNPALTGYKRNKNVRTFALPTKANVAGMEEALSSMAKCILKLVSGLKIGPASEEGYIQRGIRMFGSVTKNGAERAIEMLLNKVTNNSFDTEIHIDTPERITIAPRITNLRDAHIALVTTAGLTPAGNPSKFKVMANSQWRKYPIDKLNSMKDSEWDVIHGGVDTSSLYKDPNYGVPLDVCREMEKEGVFAKLAGDVYGTVGFMGAVAAMQNIGKEISHDLRIQGVNGVLLVST